MTPSLVLEASQVLISDFLRSQANYRQIILKKNAKMAI